MLKQQFFDMNDDLTDEARLKLAQSLVEVLADTHILYVQTHNFHWNVTGAMFVSLHALFETQYTELFNAIDLIAERVRALGFLVPATTKEFLSLSKIVESEGNIDAPKMIKVLINANEILLKNLRRAIIIADESEDSVSSDLLTTRINIHEKTLWILRSVIL